MTIKYVEKSRNRDQITLEPVNVRQPRRAFLIFTVLGLLPALGLGALVRWSLTNIGV